MKKTNIERVLIGFIAVTVSLAMFSSCAKKRYLIIDDDGPTNDSTELDETDTKFSYNNEENESGEPTVETIPDTMPSIDGVDGEESLVFELSINKNYYIVVDYTGTSDAVDIPTTYKGLNVRDIGERAFENSIIKKVTIPDGVTNIGESAFFYCTQLEEIRLPDSVTSIDDAAFAQCHSLKSVDVGEGVKFISAFAFLHCRNLVNVELSNVIEYIGDDVFQGTAYYNNDSNWTDNVLYIDNYLIEAKQGIEGEYSVREGTKIIAANAFYNQTKLTRVDIPKSVETVCSGAFAHCTALTEVSFGDTSIADGAFEGCDKLVAVYYRGSFEVEYKKDLLKGRKGHGDLLEAIWY